MYIFLNAYFLSYELKLAIENRIKGTGATVVWLYAAGVAGKNGLSIDSMSDLIGIKMDMIGNELPLETQITNIRHPISAGIHGKTYGITNVPQKKDLLRTKVAPLFYCNDPQATVLGRYSINDKPSLVVKEYDTWKSIFIGFTPMTPELLRSIAKYAGVHIYNNDDLVVLANKSYVSIRATKPCATTFNLPLECDVYDAYAGKFIATKALSINLEFNNPTTMLFDLSRNRAAE